MKSQLGGVTGGLFKEAYQVGIAGVVNKAPKKPADWHKRISPNNKPQLTFFIEG